jgi:hypothetical protein
MIPMNLAVEFTRIFRIVWFVPAFGEQIVTYVPHIGMTQMRWMTGRVG